MPASSCYESPMKKISRKAFLAGALCVPFALGPAQARTQSLCQKRILGQARDLQLFLLALSPPQSHHRTSDRENLRPRRSRGRYPSSADGRRGPRLFAQTQAPCLLERGRPYLPLHSPGLRFARCRIPQKYRAHQKCIRLAHEMGIPSIRLNSGRWGTARDFNHLMELRGKEPILPGHTEEEGFRWCIDSIEKCLPQAQKHGVHLALENHWGLTRTPEGLLRIAQAIDSPAGRPHGHRKFYGGPLRQARENRSLHHLRASQDLFRRR